MVAYHRRWYEEPFRLIVRSQQLGDYYIQHEQGSFQGDPQSSPYYNILMHSIHKRVTAAMNVYRAAYSDDTYSPSFALAFSTLKTFSELSGLRNI